jgi:hypothetical protein
MRSTIARRRALGLIVLGQGSSERRCGRSHRRVSRCLRRLRGGGPAAPVGLARGVVVHLLEADAFERRRGSRAHVSLVVVAVDDHRSTAIEPARRLPVELLERDVDRPRQVLVLVRRPAASRRLAPVGRRAAAAPPGGRSTLASALPEHSPKTARPAAVASSIDITSPAPADARRASAPHSRGRRRSSAPGNTGSTIPTRDRARPRPRPPDRGDHSAGPSGATRASIAWPLTGSRAAISIGSPNMGAIPWAFRFADLHSLRSPGSTSKGRERPPLLAAGEAASEAVGR